MLPGFGGGAKVAARQVALGHDHTVVLDEEGPRARPHCLTVGGRGQQGGRGQPPAVSQPAALLSMVAGASPGGRSRFQFAQL